METALSARFENIISEYGALLSRVASTYEANDALKQELYQEICMACWQALEKFENASSLKTYLLKIAHNRCISHVAKESSRIKNSVSTGKDGKPNDIDVDNILPSDAQTQIPVMQSNLETNAIKEQKLQTLLEAVRKLNLQNRQLITLSMEGCSYQEIADISGLSPSNVGVSISRIKADLKHKIQGIENRSSKRSA